MSTLHIHMSASHSCSRSHISLCLLEQGVRKRDLLGEKKRLKCIYIYIERERERRREATSCNLSQLLFSKISPTEFNFLDGIFAWPFDNHTPWPSNPPTHHSIYHSSSPHILSRFHPSKKMSEFEKFWCFPSPICYLTTARSSELPSSPTVTMRKDLSSHHVIGK